MIAKALRFYSVNPDGSEKLDHGTAWMTDDGELDFANESVRQMMSTMVMRVGPAKAFDFYHSGWSNGAVCAGPAPLHSAR